MQCDMCGAEGQLFKVKIEGTEMNVCRGCAGHGKILGEVRGPVTEDAVGPRMMQEEEEAPEVIQIIVPGFSDKIRRKREELGLNQKDFAIKVSEKESIIHKLETGEFEPPIGMAKKFERILGIKLVDEYTEAPVEREKAEAGGELTIGDMIKIRKRPKK